MARTGQLQRRLVFDAVLLGVVGAASALVFNAALGLLQRFLLGRVAGYMPPGIASEGGSSFERVGPHGLWLIPLVTTAGGLIVGLLTEWLAPEAEGHGTDAMVRSFHRLGGELRARVGPVKLLTSAITIGSGGSAGREGPIALATAALGSWYAQLTRRSEEERRLLLLVGAAAGISAIFRSPIGAALFSVEVLYADMEFEAGVLLYATLAAIVAYALGGVTMGFGALFRVPTPLPPLPRRLDYGWYAALGAAAGLLATALPMVFYAVRDLFRGLRVPRAVKPAIGGLLTGIMALALPELLGGGYGWIQRAIDGQLVFGLLVALAVTKIIAMSFTVASGGSGGVFAPSLYVGAMLGGAIASLTHLPPAPFVVVGMAAVFAGAAHVPFATMMMVTEMTGGYTLLVPAALAVLVSYLVQHYLSAGIRYRSVYEAQVAGRGESPAHHTRHLEIALQIIRERELSQLDHLGNVNLVALLRSGVAVDVGDGRQLSVGVLRNDSTLVGATIAERAVELSDAGIHVIGILRGQQMLSPRAETVLEGGDRLVLLAAAAGMEGLAPHLNPW